MDSPRDAKVVKQPIEGALGFTVRPVEKEWREKSSTRSPRGTTG